MLKNFGSRDKDFITSVENIIIKFLDAGTHAVISTIDELPELIDKINLRLNNDLTPHVL